MEPGIWRDICSCCGLDIVRALRIDHQKMKNTIGQARPISIRLAPVIFATARPITSGSFPARQVMEASTAYSGSTAMKAKTATAKPLEMSTSAASVVQDNRNAAPRIAMPKHVVSAIVPKSRPNNGKMNRTIGPISAIRPAASINIIDRS